MKSVKTERVITSWMIFNCHSEKGPPVSLKPIRLAGTWNMYSKKATPQLIKITTKRLTPTSLFISFNFKWPYHARVINVLEQINKKTVRRAFFILRIFQRLKLVITTNKEGFFKRYSYGNELSCLKN